jgi:hypothetical protein
MAVAAAGKCFGGPVFRMRTETDPYYSRCCVAAIVRDTAVTVAMQQQPSSGMAFPQYGLAQGPKLGFNLNNMS